MSPADVALRDLIVLLREREQKVDELNAQLGETMPAAAMWQERAGLLSDRLALAESKMAALEAAQEPESATLTASTAEHAPDPVPESSEPESPWWKRWLAALYGW